MNIHRSRPLIPLLLLLASCSQPATSNNASTDQGSTSANRTRDMEADAQEMADAGADLGPGDLGDAADAGDAGEMGEEMETYSQTACNGHDALCDRRLNEVALPGAHNAFSTRGDRFLFPNHIKSFEQQLEDGIRAMELDVHDDDGVTSLCHSRCALGSRPLIDGLTQIVDFLKSHPREVFIIKFQDEVPVDKIAQDVIASGMDTMTYTHTIGEPWPTLGEMIDAGEVVVLMTQGPGGGEMYPWIHQAWEISWDNNYAAESAEDFDCEPFRGRDGDLDAKLFSLNHFLTAPAASQALAEQVNYNPLLIDRIKKCEQEAGRLPNVIAVDFYGTGDLFEAVRQANNLP